jgi:hypothetical protein
MPQPQIVGDSTQSVFPTFGLFGFISIIYNRISGVMVSVFALSAVDCGFEP